MPRRAAPHGREPGAGRITALLPYLGVLLGIAVFIAEPPWMIEVRHGFFDRLQRWQPRPPAADPVLVVDIDDESLARIGQWPWPRTRLAQMLDRIAAQGPRAIGLDMTFPEPDRTSPKALLDLWPIASDMRRAIAALPDHDLRFAGAIGASRAVLGYALREHGANETPMRPPAFVLSGPDPSPALFHFDGRLGSIPVLEDAAGGLGHVSVVEDSDGLVRRIPVVVALAGRPAPSLALEVIRVAAGASTVLLGTSGDDGGPLALAVGALQLPLTSRGEAWIHYGFRQHDAYIPAWTVLAAGDGPPPPPRFAGRIVLVGSSAALLHDMRPTPLGEYVPGVEAHRQLIEQVVAGHHLLRPDWAPAAEALALVIGAWLVIRVAARHPPALGVLALGALAGSALAATASAFHFRGLLVDAVSPAAGWGLCFVLASLARLYRSERRQRWVRTVFSRYVSPNLVRHLVTHPEALEIGGKRQPCSFIFTDLEGFTSLIERTEPRNAVALINAYLDGMIAIVFRHEGTLIRIVGDALAVMFSAPVPQSDHARRAYDCACALDAFACRFAAEHPGPAGPFCRTRIGVHSGVVTVGNFGGSSMLEYRALGDAVNVAARLEAANKRLGTRVCVSAAILAECPGVLARPIGRLRLRGKDDLVAAFEPLPAPDPDYDAAFAQLKEGNPAALAAFTALAAARPADPLAALHRDRLQRGALDDVVDAG